MSGVTVRVQLSASTAASDPELYAQHEGELVTAYNARHPDDPVRLRARRGLRGLLRALRAS